MQVANLTYKEVGLINFPIFPIPSDEITWEDGLVRIEEKVVDDLNMIGNTVGLRRLQTPHKLYKLGKCCESVMDFFHIKGAKAYIDNFGFVFTYERTKYTYVRYKKILKVTQRDLFSIIKAEHINYGVKVPRPPGVGKEWIGILYLSGYPWVPYEYSETCQKPKLRKI
jgi:hypothetical protein